MGAEGSERNYTSKSFPMSRPWSFLSEVSPATVKPMVYYNGYSPKEREKKRRASYKIYPNHSHPYYKGPCHVCGDPNSPVEPHSEDYSEPYLWERPAEYAVCKTCHSRLHKRFKNPHAWAAYKIHLRHGGYGSDLKIGIMAKKITELGSAVKAGLVPPSIQFIRQKSLTETEWWEKLSVEMRTLTDPTARPRP
jgi:hypothetical protein